MNRFAEVPDRGRILRELEFGNRHKHHLATICDVPEKIDDTLEILIRAGMVVPLLDTGCYRISFDALNCLDALDDGVDQFLYVYEAWYGHGNEFMAEYLVCMAEAPVLSMPIARADRRPICMIIPPDYWSVADSCLEAF